MHSVNLCANAPAAVGAPRLTKCSTHSLRSLGRPASPAAR